MASIDDVALAIATQIETALAGASLATGGKVTDNWPDSSRLAAIPPGTQSPLVSVWPIGPSMKVMQAIQVPGYLVPAAVSSLVAVAQDSSIELTGTIVAGLNVHIVGGSPTTDVIVQTTPEDVAGSLDALADRIATAVATENITNLAMTASGATLSADGRPFSVNIGATVTGEQEVGWFQHRMQVDVWAPDKPTRSAIQKVITDNVANDQTPKVTLPDGSKFQLTMASAPVPSDYIVANVMLKRSTLMYQAKYRLTRSVTLTQVGAFTVTTTSMPSGVNTVSVEG